MRYALAKMLLLIFAVIITVAVGLLEGAAHYRKGNAAFPTTDSTIGAVQTPIA